MSNPLIISCHAFALTLARHDLVLTVRQLAILTTLCTHTKTHTVRSLANYLDIPRPSVSRATASLSGLGLIDSRRDPNDRRSVIVSPNKKGSRLLHDVFVTVARGDVK